MGRRTIRRAAAVLCALLALAAGPGARATGGSAREAEEAPVLSEAAEQALMERLERLHASTRTFQAAFEEARHLPSLPAPLRFEGRVYYHRDGLLFMEYVEPFRYILRVCQGEALIYIEGSGTADVSSLSGAEGLEQADVFAWDPSRFEGTVRGEPGGYRLVPSTQGPPGPGFSILLDRETLLMKEVCIFGEGGDRTELLFSNVRFNDPLPERVTDFRLPPGVERHRLDLQ